MGQKPFAYHSLSGESPSPSVIAPDTNKPVGEWQGLDGGSQNDLNRHLATTIAGVVATQPANIASIYKGDTAPTGATLAVDTNALLHFADVLDQLRAPVEDAMADLSKVNVRAGQFKHGELITQKIGGGGSGQSLAELNLTSMTNLRDGLVVWSQRMRELATKYSTAEQLNTADAAEVGKMMSDVGSYLNADAGGGYSVPAGPPSPPALST